jgi:hypothetical protein
MTLFAMLHFPAVPPEPRPPPAATEAPKVFGL